MASHATNSVPHMIVDSLPPEAEQSPPWLVTSMRECAIVFWLTWTGIGLFLFEAGDLSRSMTWLLPASLAHTLMTFVLAVPASAINCVLVLGACLILAESQSGESLERRLPLVWNAPGKPRFLGALLCLLLEAMIFAALYGLTLVASD